MTGNKRFTLKEYTSEDYAILDDGTEIAYASNKSAFTFCELLNELAEENQHLLKHLDMVREHRDELIVKNKELKQQREELFIRERNTKNQLRGLQERNNRQATTIRHLYYLIENEKWEALTAIIEDFKKSDKLLQQEWEDLE